MLIVYFLFILSFQTEKRDQFFYSAEELDDDAAAVETLGSKLPVFLLLWVPLGHFGFLPIGSQFPVIRLRFVPSGHLDFFV